MHRCEDRLLEQKIVVGVFIWLVLVLIALLNGGFEMILEKLVDILLILNGIVGDDEFFFFRDGN